MVFAAVFIPIAMVPPLSGAPRQVNPFCTIIAAGLSGLAVLALLSRVYAKGNRGRRAVLLKRVGIGLSLAAAAIVIALISMAYGTFAAFGNVFFIAPAGLYVAGLLAIARALS